MRCNGSNWAVYPPGSWDGFRNDVWALWAGVIMRLEHHLVGGYVRYISPHIIIIIIIIILIYTSWCEVGSKHPEILFRLTCCILWENVFYRVQWKQIHINVLYKFEMDFAHPPTRAELQWQVATVVKISQLTVLTVEPNVYNGYQIVLLPVKNSRFTEGLTVFDF